MRLAIRLYPAAWRARYGDEFRALLEDMKPARGDVWNVAKGALHMRILTWSSWRLISTLGLAGAITMAVAAVLVQPVYESGAVLRVVNSSDLRSELGELRTTALSRKTLAGIIAAEKLYPGETETRAIARMQRNILITPALSGEGRLPFLLISFRYPDARQARRVVEDLTAFSQAEVIDGPVAPGRPVLPNRPLMVAVGLAAGLLLGLLYCARSGWPVVLLCGVAGALLGVYGFALAWGRHVPQAATRPLAITGFLAGVLLGAVAVMWRRRKAVAST
ncbi:MAG TPA: hypothetical protein VMU19_12305 [Bryobacteraceae bacterium]|nr:hypothetical protein [Bryobacteraceae bacterium]